MRSIDSNNLQVGMRTQDEYFSVSGELLIARGVVITERHLSILRRRNIFEVYVKDRDHELHEILNTEFSKLENIQFRERSDAPKALQVLPELRDLAAGEKGLQQLLASRRGLTLDRELRAGHTWDRPVGPPLHNRIRQIPAALRDTHYKDEIRNSYERALLDVQKILVKLSDANKIDGTEIRAIVERFMRTFVSDRNILLNLNWTKQKSEDHLFYHTLNVALLALNIATSCGYSEEQVVHIGMSALLHDVGMMLIPREICLKNGKLSSEEWFEIQKHPILGLHLLEKVNRLPDAIPYVAYQIHERENGKGYPRKRSGKHIHSYAKIVQLADIFEAVSSPRLYRAPYAPYQGMEMLIRMSQQGYLSSEYVKAFLAYTSLFPIGSLVELSDNRIGKVVAANGSLYTKPIVSVLREKNGVVLDASAVYQVDLKEEQDLGIQRALAFDALDGVELMDGF